MNEMGIKPVACKSVRNSAATPMNRENRLLVTDEPVEFEK